MGENGGLGQPSGMLPHGLFPDQVANVTRVLDVDRWLKAEERTTELISRIQPNELSEERRIAVANYVSQLITNCLACKVFTFGSVPLKTYLPDGDIDLTAFSDNESLKDTWANTVRDVLEKEEKSEHAEFCVKEVQYIQAEVKLVKCLVENIVVDISFNQLGGLCTLCFLEEIDMLINKNHLFKRSIILIKAWCYYESRILGAHHGLISTYALETLVLYIFHVFNNRFSGPLEVLYCFLQFFSNFDWGKFCISLWGPVPISSLPDMTAEPPRKDNGKVLLSAEFLDSRSKTYAAPPGGHENHGQPFVSKHFNVVDPLRTNNNLGRSVSKGNFYRIRSAFAYGVKRLTMLLECPKEDIVAEVNQFFINTWERYGSEERPDVPTIDLRHLRDLKAANIEDISNKNARRRMENLSLNASHEQLKGTSPGLQDTISELFNDFSQNAQNIHVAYPSVISHTQNQKCQNLRSISRVPDQFDGNSSSSGSTHNGNIQTTVISSSSLSDQVQSRSQYARTKSSPELTEASFGLSRGRRNRALEFTKNQNPHLNSDLGCRQFSGSEVTGSINRKSSFDDPQSARHISSYRGPEVSFDSNSYDADMGFVNMGDELASVSETLDMQQEEQDFVNLMGSCNLNSFNGRVPMHLASHLPLTLSHVAAPMGYPQRNLAGFLPSNLSVIRPSWGESMFHQGLISSPLPQYVNVANLNSIPDDMIKPLNEGSGAIERNSVENCDTCHEQISIGSNHNDTGTRKLHMDAKQLKSHSGLNFIPSSHGNNAGIAMPRGHKLGKEDRGSTEGDYNDSLQNQTNKGADNNSSLWGENMKFLPISQARSRSKSASENTRDGSTSKFSKIARDKWGKRQVAVPSEVEEGLHWTPLSSAGMDVPERLSRSPSLSSPHSRSQLIPGFEPAAQVGESDPSVPIGPMLVGTSRQRRVENANVLPGTFVPTGPPVPFLYYPMLNFTSVTGIAEGFTNQHAIELDQSEPNSSDQNADLTGKVDQPKAFLSSVSLSSAPELSDDHEHKPDILNSDFASHLENLAYGRSCQNLGYPGPLIYSTPVYAPSPVYLQGHYPWDGPGRPTSSNTNIAQIMGYGSRAVPGMPLQPDRSSNMFHGYGDDAPRYHGGTGTYLPNPKASFRERRSSSRNHGGYGHDRNEHGDREGNWISLKQQRAGGRNHGRNHAERGNVRSDRLAAGEKQTERLWESYQHEPVSLHTVHNNSMGSSNRLHNSANVAGVFAEAPPSSNGMNPSLRVAPPVMMVYSYNQDVGYTPSGEPLEFGSLGPLHLVRANEASWTHEQRCRTYRGRSPRSSPDRPSSPRRKR